MPFVIFFIGSAGAGKSSLAGKFGAWIKEHRGQRIKLANLDPGAIVLPFQTDFNIREFFTVENIMIQENLGPNGAIIRANEKVLERFDKILETFKNFETDFILIDTPGQLEVFLFKDIAVKIFERLNRNFKVIGINLIDPSITRTASELVIAQLFGLILSFRLGIEISTILHKSDLPEHDNIKKLLEDQKFLIKRVREEKGTMADLVLPIIDHLISLRSSAKIISTSIYNNRGFEDLYNRINEHFCACGDLT